MTGVDEANAPLRVRNVQKVLVGTTEDKPSPIVLQRLGDSVREMSRRVPAAVEHVDERVARVDRDARLRVRQARLARVGGERAVSENRMAGWRSAVPVGMYGWRANQTHRCAMSRLYTFPSNNTLSTPAYARSSAERSVGAYADTAMTRPPEVTTCSPFCAVPAWKATTPV